MLTPAADQAVKQHETRYERMMPSRFSARTIGDMALLDVGCVAWSRTEGEQRKVQADIFDGVEGRGGIIVNVIDTSTADDDTGEVSHVRSFRCYDPHLPPQHHYAWVTLTEAMVDLEACEPVDIAQIRRAYRRMFAHVGSQKGQAGGMELDLIAAGSRLAAVVGQTR